MKYHDIDYRFHKLVSCLEETFKKTFWFEDRFYFQEFWSGGLQSTKTMSLLHSICNRVVRPSPRRSAQYISELIGIVFVDDLFKRIVHGVTDK